jgi:hypothetical protein
MTGVAATTAAQPFLGVNIAYAVPRFARVLTCVFVRILVTRAVQLRAVVGQRERSRDRVTIGVTC